MHIIIKNLKQFFRDKVTVMWNLVFPIVLVFILSTMLAPMYETEKKVEPINIDVVNTSSDEMSVDNFINFIDEISNQDLITYTNSNDLSTSKTRLENEIITSIINLEGSTMSIEMIKNSPSIESRIVESFIKGYIENEKIIQSIIKIDPSLLSELDYNTKNYIDNSDGGVGIAIMDYYGIAMIIMNIFMLSFVASFENYHKEKDDKTLVRLKTSPKNQFMMFIQMNLSSIPQSLLQISVIMLGCVWILNVEYCSNMQDNLLLFSMLLMLTLAVTSLGSLLAVLLKKGSIGLVSGVFWFMLLMSGTFSKEVFVEGFSNFMPAYIVQQAAFDLTLYGRSTDVVIVLIVSTILFLLFNLIGALIFAKRGIET